MKAIVAKYLSPTVQRGSRIKVYAYGWKSFTDSRRYDMDYDDQAAMMAKMLLESFCPDNTFDLVKGTLPNGDLVFCLQEGGNNE